VCNKRGRQVQGKERGKRSGRNGARAVCFGVNVGGSKSGMRDTTQIFLENKRFARKSWALTEESDFGSIWKMLIALLKNEKKREQQWGSRPSARDCGEREETEEEGTAKKRALS